jgi:phage gpG-like protein
MEIRFEITDDGLAEGLRRAVRAAEDFTPAMAAIATLMRTEVDDRFDEERGPDAAPWLPSLRARLHGGKTLQNKGVNGGLLGSLLGSATSDATSAVIGTNLVYAAIHQRGFRGKVPVPAHERTVRQAFGKPLAKPVRATVKAHDRAVDLPARPFLGFSAYEQDEIPRILADHLETAFGSAS